MSLAKDLYPDCFHGEGASRWFEAPSDYAPILSSFGKIVIQCDEKEYQGDSWVLYNVNDKIGFLNFGWGSCSGCDALLCCSSYEELDTLIEQLRNNIKWFESKGAALDWFKTHEWKGDYCCYIDELKQFLREAIDYLSA